MNDIWQTILLGIIEGISEFLPISSTGHLLIAEHWMGEKSETFNIFIQLGAVLAVCLIYKERVSSFFFLWKNKEKIPYFLKLGLAFFITALLGLWVKKMGWELPKDLGPVIIAIFGGAFWIYFVEKVSCRNQSFVEDISWLTAIAVGVSQVVAGVLPGFSRSAATILMAVLFGVSRPAATEFAFLLGIPTMFAASLFSWVEQTNFLKVPPTDPPLTLFLGFFVSAIVAFIAVKWLLSFIQTHTFIPFVWYRVGLGLILLMIFAIEWKSH
ncbi:undecaprenyl-diphosphate phosphatase [Candidatus Methylacidiphilum fumarolicum]|uniref:Undecaprenyl-diphosphatase n=2 Tax=Candidatus Methylacidiphilum fumarolicum TaxID=591154 RepID=I0JX12_METFB|nr:undecaprenyl-diphosphate phosphatase [Candidatus Methylacidiphilum fumarolicum]MBW6414473.1 undecaprenyl-diphosphate phosphatase [Candidatus Methylacidiphilum fumarolicum]TFE69471.1 undecaprenyl-diphosphatase [Candidatus Methylacidiphilum fumarolicum]TFE72828.1 undecaprenyl-diphosphate phosphatase [Candidatus Methylacidiphilum fumarolicum]TFE74572.1 undecaprenyl-diphosphate phosphatase [Candidatus Methylacidiphilum fumarolicum]TFE77134.1 undecaprenyl-diphosphatase [Candidatus Methylacidiphi